jgi:hypothetical protein
MTRITVLVMPSVNDAKVHVPISVVREWADLLIGTATVSDDHPTAPLMRCIANRLKDADANIQVRMEEYQEKGLAKAWLMAWKGNGSLEDGLMFSAHGPGCLRS